MLAIFGAYDEKRGGTLLPVTLTKGWKIENANGLATPLSVDLYEETGKRKGVLAVQIQSVREGEVDESHVSAAEVSVYVFGFNGSNWVFEKGKKSVIKTGAYGKAPGNRLIRIGDAKFGLLFEGGDVHQGYFDQYASMISLGEPKIAAVFDASTGHDNSGACTDDEKELKDVDLGLKRCWGHATEISFVRIAGDDYYMLRLDDSGTEEDEKTGKVVPVKRVTYLRMRPEGYKPVEGEAVTGERVPNEVVQGGGVTVLRSVGR